jgi:hypothetical protein
LVPQSSCQIQHSQHIWDIATEYDGLEANLHVYLDQEEQPIFSKPSGIPVVHFTNVNNDIESA